MAANILSGFAFAIALLMAPPSLPLEVHKQSGDSAPQAQQGDQLDPHPMLEILPASFVGCWRGVVAAPDSLQSVNGCEAGPFVPELYTLCYRKSLSGKFELTFSGVAMDTAVPADYKVSATAGRVQVLSSDGVARVKLRSFIHFDENQPGAASRDAKWSMDERTDLDCLIKNGEMQVNATYAQTSNGADCFKGTWHTMFQPSKE
jgi:hypothetical protein